jgi:hypothetical protein
MPRSKPSWPSCLALLGLLGCNQGAPSTPASTAPASTPPASTAPASTTPSKAAASAAPSQAAAPATTASKTLDPVWAQIQPLLAGFSACTSSINANKCPPYAQLEAIAKAAKGDEAKQTATYTALLRAVEAGPPRATYAAVYLANFTVRLPATLKDDLAIGQRLLAALKASKPDAYRYAAVRIAEHLGSGWGQTKHAALRAALTAYLDDRSQLLRGRAELWRMMGYHFGTDAALAQQAIPRVADPTEDPKISGQIIRLSFRIRQPELIKPLESALFAALNGAQAKIKGDAAQALATRGLGFDEVVAWYQSDKAGAAYSAGWALTELAKAKSKQVKGAQIVKAARAILDEPSLSGFHRKGALGAIRHAGTPDAAKLLARYGKDKDASVAAEANALLAALKK